MSTNKTAASYYASYHQECSVFLRSD